jgi:membrane dipeptidase
MSIGKVILSKYTQAIWLKIDYSPEDESDRSTENHFQALLQTLQQIDLIHRLVKRYESRLVIAKNSSDIMKIFHRGQITVLISIEGLHQIGNSFSVLRNYYRLGVRCATLAHNKNNTYAGSAVRLLYRFCSRR